MPYVDALRASAEIVPSAQLPAPAASAEETEKILAWLEEPGVRIVDIDGAWTCPVGGAQAHHLTLLSDLGAPVRTAAAMMTA